MAKEKIRIDKANWRKALKAKSLSQARFAEELGYAPEHLSRLVNSSITKEQLETICEKLNINPDYLTKQNKQDISEKKNIMQEFGLSHDESDTLIDYEKSYAYYDSKLRQERISEIIKELLVLCGYKKETYENAIKAYDYDKLQRKIYVYGKELPLYSFDDQLAVRINMTISAFFEEIGFDSNEYNITVPVNIE